MEAFRRVCAKLYSHPGLFAGVMLCTALATFFRTDRHINGHALAHWLINYEEGFIKRGLMGTLFQLRAVSDYTGLAVETWYWGWIHFFLILLYLCVLFICWKIYRLNRHWAYAITPYFLAGPFLLSNTSFIGYFDQIVAMMVMAVAFFLMKERVVVAAILAGASVFIHENTVLLVLPLYGYWVFLKISLADTYRSVNYRQILREALVPLVTLGCFMAVFYYYELALSFQEKADYIAQTIAPYEAFKRGPVSITRTLTTTYLEWWSTESEVVFLRFFDFFGFATILAPLFAASWLIAQTLTRNLLQQRFYCGAVFFLMIFPLSIFLMAFDVYRFWTFPVVLAMIFVFWALNRSAVSIHFNPVKKFRELRWAMAVATIFTILGYWPYRDASLAMRYLMYSPLFLWYACYLIGAGLHEAESVGHAQSGH
jgi:hypothetical protein